MRKIWIATTTSLLLAAVLATNAIAISHSVTPSSQSRAYGVASNWTQSWGGNAPFDVAFCPRNTA